MDQEVESSTVDHGMRLAFPVNVAAFIQLKSIQRLTSAEPDS